MKRLIAGMMVAALAGCQAYQPVSRDALERIDSELASAAKREPAAAQPEAVSNALMPPIRVELPKEAGKPLEPRFDLVVNNAPAGQVFMSIVSGTRYSMLIHPEVAGTLSVNLKDVTVFEALDAIREMYGYEYKVEGSRIHVQPLTLQTRVYQVSYLTGQRQGRSELRVTTSTVIGGTPANQPVGVAPTAPMLGGQALVESANVRTTRSTDLWDEIARALTAIVGNAPGRSVVVSPQSGVIVVRAMPDELRNVAAYLRASRISVERQVIIEAKILEVQLKEGYEQGINWSVFSNTPNSGLSTGVITPGTLLQRFPNTPLATGATASGDTSSVVFTTPTLVSEPGRDLLAGLVSGGIFGLAFQNASFAALISFLETQGTVHVLSSPRLATINNQPAVLKVGQDELFVTNVSGSNTNASSSTLTTTISIPTVTFQSFFSGVALDLTPRIDDHDAIVLHIHPSVSDVQQVNRRIDTGIAGTFNIPVPRSSVQETDTMVRAQDGQVVVIGGLMKQSQTEDASQVPVAGEMPILGPLFRNTKRAAEKRELVILLKPTVVKGDGAWSRDIQESKERIERLGQPGTTYGK